MAPSERCSRCGGACDGLLPGLLLKQLALLLEVTQLHQSIGRLLEDVLHPVRLSREPAVSRCETRSASVRWPRSKRSARGSLTDSEPVLFLVASAVMSFFWAANESCGRVDRAIGLNRIKGVVRRQTSPAERVSQTHSRAGLDRLGLRASPCASSRVRPAWPSHLGLTCCADVRVCGLNESPSVHSRARRFRPMPGSGPGSAKQAS